MFFQWFPKPLKKRGDKMEKARNSNLLKIVCYILIPILVAILGLSIFHIAFLSEFENKEGETKYSQTENFANNYIYFFMDKITECKNVKQSYYFIELEDSQGNPYYYSKSKENYNSFNGIGAYINYVIVEKETRKDVYEYKK